jgi:hypothetical protein
MLVCLLAYRYHEIKVAYPAVVASTVSGPSFLKLPTGITFCYCVDAAHVRALYNVDASTKVICRLIKSWNEYEKTSPRPIQRFMEVCWVKSAQRRNASCRGRMTVWAQQRLSSQQRRVITNHKRNHRFCSFAIGFECQAVAYIY